MRFVDAATAAQTDWVDAASLVLAAARPTPRLAVRLAADTDDAVLDTLAAHLPRVVTLALPFGKWVDGRAYSIAWLLRRRYGYNGELRAVGEVLVDMLPLLRRCGFDAVELRADQSQTAAERALGFFEEHYQGDIGQALPRYRRTAGASVAART
jgi:uncharacterized protein (DUF934 family)